MDQLFRLLTIEDLPYLEAMETGINVHNRYQLIIPLNFPLPGC